MHRLGVQRPLDLLAALRQVSCYRASVVASSTLLTSTKSAGGWVGETNQLGHSKRTDAGNRRSLSQRRTSRKETHSFRVRRGHLLPSGTCHPTSATDPLSSRVRRSIS